MDLPVEANLQKVKGKIAMETKNMDSIRNKFKKVILKGYRGRPLIRYARRRDDGIIMIKSERSLNKLLYLQKDIEDIDWIGWPEDDVYSYDESTYDQLFNFYQNDNQPNLKKGWSEHTRASL